MKELIAESLTHIFSFLLFMWILKRYAWTPLIELMDARRDHIRQRVEAAAEAKAAAEEERHRLEETKARLEAEAESKVQEALRRARDVAQTIEQKAHDEASRILRTAREQAEADRLHAREALEKETAQLALETAEKLLRDVMDQQLHEKLISKLLADLDSRQEGGTP